MQTITKTLNAVRGTVDYISGKPELVLSGATGQPVLTIAGRTLHLDGFTKRLSALIGVPIDRAIAPLLPDRADLANQVLAAYAASLPELSAITRESQLVALYDTMIPDPRPVLELCEQAGYTYAEVSDQDCFAVTAYSDAADYQDYDEGDPVRVGMGIFYEPRIRLRFLLDRLECQNGMVSSENYLVASSDLTKDLVEHLVLGAVEFRKEFYHMKHESIKHDEAELMLRRCLEEIGLSDRDMKHVMESFWLKFKGNTDLTMYDVINHVSAMANTTGNMRFKRYAGKMIVQTSAERCPKCLRQL